MSDEETQPSSQGPKDDRSRSKRFRFKRTKDESADDQSEPHRHRHHHHRRHHHRSKRRRTSPSFRDDPTAYDDTVPNLPPDTAFRESLFDALGDDEGAAFWQGVYGQPIHTYPKTYKDQETGELEQMNDDDYAQYVRRRMWEKSREGIEAARAEQRRQKVSGEENQSRQQKKEKSDSTGDHDYSFVFDIEFEKSLERGKRRRDKQRWKQLWTAYLSQWQDLQDIYEAHKTRPSDTGQVFLRNKIAWPVESGKRKDVAPATIETFFRNCADVDESQRDLSTILKAERVRWHPDKIQQRYGFLQIEDSTIQGVTAVFQALDNLWSEQRSKHP